jgi:hypothetical protein
VLAELLGTELEIVVRRTQPLAHSRALEGGAGVLLARADAPQVARAALVEAELALIAAMVARVAKRGSPVVSDVAASAGPGAVGAFAAILVAASRRAHAGVPLRVLAAGPGPALEADLARQDPELWAVTLTVLLARDAFEARIVVPRAAALAAPGSRWDGQALAALGATPLALPLVACALRVTATDVARLEPGDALLLGGWPLDRPTGGGLLGPVLLASPSAELGLRARLVEDGRLVLGAEVVPLCAAEADMGEGIDRGGLVEAIGEVPVVVRVEIGEARMAARDWAALGRGDVVALGRRVGEAVVLRVGGVPVARGDLVEIDGEVGVRIVERLAADETSS